MNKNVRLSTLEIVTTPTREVRFRGAPRPKKYKKSTGWNEQVAQHNDAQQVARNDTGDFLAAAEACGCLHSDWRGGGEREQWLSEAWLKCIQTKTTRLTFAFSDNAQSILQNNATHSRLSDTVNY